MRVSAFNNKMRSVMRDNMYDRQVSGFRSGKLNGKTLYKSQIQNQTKLFTRKQERENKEYFIHILLDVSGSMSDEMDYTDSESKSRLDVATNMVGILVNGLEKNNINFALSYFGNGYAEEKVFHKKLDKKFKSKARNLMVGDLGAGTREGEALSKSYEVISKVGKSRNNRFVMVFTDGHSGDQIHEPLKKILKIAKVFPFGIGMDIAETHGFGMKVCNEDIFMTKLLRSLENNIKRG